MDHKGLGQFEVKDETKGEVEAVFATLNVKDHDNDVTLPGAFENGAEVVISAYGHKSWEGALPVGKGTISEVGNTVRMKGQFFLNTAAGRDTFEVVKQLGAKGEWSYGFGVDQSEPGEHEGKSVRFLKKMTVHEVSPVLRGAGMGTTTTYAKGFRTLAEEISSAVDAVKGAVESAKRVVALRTEKGDKLSNVNAESLVGLKAQLAELETLVGQKASEQDVVDNDEELRQIELALTLDTLEGE